jgi:hypothetical protein
MRLNWGFQKSVGFGRIAKTVLATFLGLQILFLLALAACPALHHALHADSDKADHDCLVTAFVKGALNDEEMTPMPIVAVVFLIFAVSLPNVFPRSPLKYGFSPGRAPPRS